MSGHSKWHNIQAKKGKADAARGAVFTKIGREIAIAVRDGGANPESNGKLRDIIAKAKANNMPNDNIQRSIKKASGELSNVTYEQITYEGYAPGGVAVIVETMTDNRNRTAADLRHYFDKNVQKVFAYLGWEQKRRQPRHDWLRQLHVRREGRSGGGAHSRFGRRRNDDDGAGRWCGRHEGG